ncbi:MAG: 50S ribosomal protein L24e [Candidatus Pacearchaeota archaeon]
MPTCSFCRKNFKEPRGLTVFTLDGRAIYFCSSKCRKNMEKLKRDPRKTKWVKKRTDFYLDSEEITKENNETS